MGTNGKSEEKNEKKSGPGKNSGSGGWPTDPDMLQKDKKRGYLKIQQL
jgi:hypothetical protein